MKNVVMQTIAFYWHPERGKESRRFGRADLAYDFAAATSRRTGFRDHDVFISPEDQPERKIYFIGGNAFKEVDKDEAMTFFCLGKLAEVGK